MLFCIEKIFPIKSNSKFFLKNYLFICIISFLTFSIAKTQSLGSIISSLNFSSYDQLPFWLLSNNDGVNNKTSTLIFTYKKNLKNYDFGMDLVLPTNNYRSAYPNQIFFTYKKYPLHLQIGSKSSLVRKKTLSIGSLVESGNASPIPKIKLGFLDYQNASLKKIDFQYKAKIAHGLIYSQQYLINPYLHEKSVDFKKNISKNSSLHFGLEHMAIWGGETIQHGKQPARLSDYFRVMFAISGGKNSINQEQKNSLGNHLGIWTFSYETKYKDKTLKLYMEHPFEDESGARWILNEFDGLYGIKIKQEKSFYVSNFSYEYINTMDQSGSSGASDSTYGWDNYYNHYLYQSGWTNNGRVIGNPLFTLGSNKGRYSNGQYIINNRLKAHHFGFLGSISKKIHYKIFYTYSENFGTYTDEDYFKSINTKYAFDGGLIQRSGLIELSINNLFESMNFSIAYGFDNGELLNKTDSFMLKINHKFVF